MQTKKRGDNDERNGKHEEETTQITTRTDTTNRNLHLPSLPFHSKHETLHTEPQPSVSRKGKREGMEGEVGYGDRGGRGITYEPRKVLSCGRRQREERALRDGGFRAARRQVCLSWPNGLVTAGNGGECVGEET